MNFKTLLIALVILITSISYSQTGGEISITADSLNKTESKSLTIHTKWKFKAGDNLNWAKKNFNDSDWFFTNSLLFLDSLKADLITGKAWFRLKINVDSSLFNKIISVGIFQRGASEIYFDGKFIKEFGKYGNADVEDPYNPQNIPIAIQLDSSDFHVLAVRYSYHDAISKYNILGKVASFAGFRLSIGVLNESIFQRVSNLRTNVSLNLSLFGILISLALLHLLIYLFYKIEKANLYYFFFTFSMAGIFLLGYLTSNTTNAESFPFLSIIQNIFAIGIFVFLIMLLYSITYLKYPKFFWLILIYAIAVLVLVFTNPRVSFLNTFLGIFVAIVVIESIRVIIKAIRKKISGSWIIGIGAIGFILLVAFVYTLNLLDIEDVGISETLLIFILYTGFVSIPVSMSVYLARSFAKTNKDLSEKLVEVKELSDKAIEQERSNAELRVQSEREKAKTREAELQTKALQIENDRKAKELEEARQLQLSMLPKSIPKIPNIDIGVFMQTATEVGGDYYDFHLAADNTLTVVLGDATGHGVKAGVMVTTIKSLFIQNAEANSLKMFNHFNESIKQMKFDKLYMCLLIAKINNDKMSLVNAGIPPVFIYRNKSQKIEKIVQKSMPLGAFQDFPYKENEIDLNSGDTILMMSDGFPEMHNQNREMFGYDRVKEEFSKSINNSPDEIIEKLNLKVKEWRNGNSPDDDVTFIVMKIK